MISLLLISAEVLQVSMFLSCTVTVSHGFEPRTDLGGVGDLDEEVPLGNPRLAVGVKICEGNGDEAIYCVHFW